MPTSVSQRTTTEREEAVAIAVSSMNIMGDGTIEDFRRICHPAATNRESIAEPPATRGTGPDAWFATALWLRSAFSDISFEIHETVVEADLVVVHATMSGLHTGNFVTYSPEATVARAFAPTGRSFAVLHTHWLRIQDGQVIEHWANRDDQGLAMQLGWVPPSPLYLFRCARATAKARRRG